MDNQSQSNRADGRQTPCNLPLSRAARQLFRREASSILLHYFGNTSKREGSGHYRLLNDPLNPSQEVSVDKLRRSRQKLSRFSVDDGLSDDAWFSLLSFAIDYSQTNNNTASQTAFCPLHPKHDLILPNERYSFQLTRRYLTASFTKRFGGFSLPFSGRMARAALIDSEQLVKKPHFDFSISPQGKYANNVYIFQCGHCEKTFLSTYYLDKHMEKHHPSLLAEVDSTKGLQESLSICPEDICDHLGGFTACADSLRRVSPYYGPGTMLGKEYLIHRSDSLFLSSFHNLLFFLYGGKGSLDINADNDEHIKDGAKNQPLKERDISQVAGEMHRRSLHRTNVYIQEMQATHFKKMHEPDGEGESKHERLLYSTTTESCSDTEMLKLFKKCQDLMFTCFGNEFDHHDDSSTSNRHSETLVNDLITQICEPLHCNHRLHRMAGHKQLHFVHFNEDWHQHHTFTLGFCGWLIVLIVLMFYGLAFVFGVDFFADNVLPRHVRRKKYA